MNTIIEDTKNYIINQLLDDNQLQLEASTTLISSGIIDSISTLKLVDYLEKKYNIEVLPHEVDKDNLDTLNLIKTFIESKLS